MTITQTIQAALKLERHLRTCTADLVRQGEIDRDDVHAWKLRCFTHCAVALQITTDDEALQVAVAISRLADSIDRVGSGLDTMQQEIDSVSLRVEVIEHALFDRSQPN